MHSDFLVRRPCLPISRAVVLTSIKPFFVSIIELRQSELMIAFDVGGDMPRYYFHLRAEGKLLEDEQGLELPSFSAARYEALLGAREIVAEAIKCGAQELPDSFLIADEAGRPLETVPFSAVLPTSLKK